MSQNFISSNCLVDYSDFACEKRISTLVLQLEDMQQQVLQSIRARHERDNRDSR